MTRQELSTLPHIASVGEAFSYFLLRTDEGYQITSYAEGDTIENYRSCRSLSLPLRYSYPDTYRVITDAEAKILAARLDAARKAKETAGTETTQTETAE